MKIKIVMCEGDHDVAFISKIMRTQGYHNNKTAIGDFPLYLSKFLKSQFDVAQVDHFPVNEARHGMIFPSFALTPKDSPDELLLLFRMRGDSREDLRRKLAGDFNTLFQANVTWSQREDDQLYLIYFFDADQKGIDYRINQVNKEVQRIVSDFPGLKENASYLAHRNVMWGIYVFAKEDGTGKLEDIVLPMMVQDNDDIYADINNIVQHRGQYALFQKTKPTMQEQKACIGMMGQLEKAGVPNAAIIEQSSFITDEKVKASTVCMRIATFLQL